MNQAILSKKIFTLQNVRVEQHNQQDNKLEILLYFTRKWISPLTLYRDGLKKIAAKGVIFAQSASVFCFILWQFCNRLLLALTDLQSSWSEVQDVLHTKLIYWFNLPKKIPIEWSNSPWLYMYYETLQMCASFSDDVKTILKVLDWFFFKCLIFLISIYTILVLCTLWIMNDMQAKVQYLLHIYIVHSRTTRLQPRSRRNLYNLMSDSPWSLTPSAAT